MRRISALVTCLVAILVVPGAFAAERPEALPNMRLWGDHNPPMERAVAQSCGPTQTAIGNGFGNNCTAARNDLIAFLNFVMAQDCTPNGVCAVGKLGITQACAFDPNLGLFAIWGFREFACFP